MSADANWFSIKLEKSVDSLSAARRASPSRRTTLDPHRPWFALFAFSACAINPISPRPDSGPPGDVAIVLIDSGSSGFDAGRPVDVGGGSDAGPPPGSDAGPPPGFDGGGGGFDAGPPGFDAGPARPVGTQARRFAAALQGQVTAFCMCDVEDMFYLSIAECMADNPPADPADVDCAQVAVDRAPADAAIFDCLSGASESYATCVRGLPCSDINGAGTMLDQCDITLETAQSSCGFLSPETGAAVNDCGLGL